MAIGNEGFGIGDSVATIERREVFAWFTRRMPVSLAAPAIAGHSELGGAPAVEAFAETSRDSR